MNTMNDNVKCHDFITLIIKVVDYCNFECDFCRYYQNRDRKSTSMTIETFEKIVLKAVEYNISKDVNGITVIFHGGEPLLWGMDNFVKAMEIEDKLKKEYNNIRFHNDIQTNAALINDGWADFFEKNNFSIGVSIDGPDEINFHKSRIIPSSIVLNNLSILRKHKCKYGILTVITEKHKGKAKKYYEFLKQNDIHSVGFCYCYDPNEIDIVSNETLTEFLLEFFKEYYYGDYKLHVREYEFVMKLCLGIRTDGCTFSYGKSCGNFYSVHPDGTIYHCDSYSLDEEKLGNLLTDAIEDIKHNKDLINKLDGYKMVMLKECGNCEIRDICGGGCARHILSNHKHAFCETYKEVYPYIERTIKDERKKE